MPSGPCDLEVLIFDSWSCTPLSEIVNSGIFPCGLSFRFGSLEFPSYVKTLLLTDCLRLLLFACHR